MSLYAIALQFPFTGTEWFLELDYSEHLWDEVEHWLLQPIAETLLMLLCLNEKKNLAPSFINTKEE